MAVVPMLLLSLFSSLTPTIAFANESVSTQKIEYSATDLTESQKEQESFSEKDWEQTKNFIDRAGDPWLSTLPLKDEDGFDEYLDTNDYGIFKCDEAIKSKIYATVKELIAKVDRMTPTAGMSEEEIQQKIASSEIDKYYKLPRDLRIAEAVYSWVATNIHYDHRLVDNDTSDIYNPDNDKFDRMNPGVVFTRKDGLCTGYSALIKLMMRMAGIPCTLIGSRKGKDGVGHEFNAIYVKKATGEEGWTLLDATWGAVIDDETSYEHTEYEDAVRKNVTCYEDEENGWHAFDVARYLMGDFVESTKPKFEYEVSGEIVDEYITKIKSIFEDELSKNKELFDQDRKTAVDKMNISLKEKIHNLNNQYADKEFTKIIKCEFSLYKNSNEEHECMKLSLENNKKALKKSNLQLYFPAFYHEKTKIAKDNMAIMQDDYHKIKEVQGMFETTYVINGVEYKVNDDCIEVSSASDRKVALEIPKTIVDQKLKFVIGSGIEKLRLAGDEEIDISNADDLKYVDTTNSTRYRFEEGILYDSDT